MQRSHDEIDLARVRVTGPEQAMAVFRQLDRFGVDRVALAALILDQSQRVCGARIAPPWTSDAVKWLDACILTDPQVAGPRALVLVVSRPGGSTVPAPCDLTVWRDARLLCRSRDTVLLDVLIVSGHRWRSLVETCDPSAG